MPNFKVDKNLKGHLHSQRHKNACNVSSESKTLIQGNLLD